MFRCLSRDSKSVCQFTAITLGSARRSRVIRNLKLMISIKGTHYSGPPHRSCQTQCQKDNYRIQSSNLCSHPRRAATDSTFPSEMNSSICLDATMKSQGCVTSSFALQVAPFHLVSDSTLDCEKIGVAVHMLDEARSRYFAPTYCKMKINRKDLSN